jgi:hypothetical protein
VQAVRARESGGVRRDAENIFVIVNSRAAKIEESKSQNQQTPRNETRQTSSRTTSIAFVALVFVRPKEGCGLDILFLSLDHRQDR